MRFIVVLFLFINFPSYAQNQKSHEADSVGYYINLSNFNLKKNSYKSSLNFAQKAVYYAKSTKDNTKQAIAYATLASIYLDLKKFDDAIETYDKNLTFYKEEKPSAQQAFSFYKLGLCYIEKNNFNRAEYYFNKAQNIYETINIPGAIELLYLQKGIIYREKGLDLLAIPIFEQIISKTDDEDLFKTKAEALYQIGNIEANKNRNNLALNYLNRANELNSKGTDIEQKSKIILALSQVNEKMLNIKNAHSLLKAHIVLKDSINYINDLKLADGDFIGFNENETLKTVDQLNKENKEQIKSGKVAKLISILAIALISILSLLSLSLYKNNIIRNETNLILKEKNKELEIAKDKAEKASKARSEFLSTVSHELRTPLNAINGITHLLLEEKPKETQLNYLTSLQFSGNYLLTFINEILEINRIESGKIEVEKINFDLKLLIGNIHHSLKELAQVNKNIFSLEIEENIPDYLVGDPTKLSQIFLNLINNALKFTYNGEVKVLLKVINTEINNTQIHFEILDTGIGIAEDKIETIFDSFSQGSIEINRKYGGTGLGLAIVKKLIQILGGTIKLESKLGQGSSFTFDLDFENGTADLPLEIISNYDESVLKNKKILLIEDNKINQMITKKMLENKGIYCHVIDNGEDAVEAVKNNFYDLVLMDVHLPGINGTIATQTIRTFDTITPIIALTAISLDENRELLLSFGMNDVITKPFNPNNFYKIIAENISKTNTLI